MSNYIEDLISRFHNDNYLPEFQKKPGFFESSKTISKAAYDEARELNDLNYQTNLKQIIESHQTQERKKAAQFILGCIGKNSEKVELINYLTTRLTIEQNRDLLETNLILLADTFKATEVDIKPIISLLNYIHWQVRSCAIMALTNTSHDTEEHILKLLNTPIAQVDIERCLSALMYKGTEKGLEDLKPFIKSRKPMAREYARNAYAFILIRMGKEDSEIIKKSRHDNDTVVHLRTVVHKFR